MRERTTWNRSRIASDLRKVAEDPRAMNQDHHSQQPASDAYVTGSPSDFAEDVTPSNWKVELDGEGNTKRNEIGMPEMRPESMKEAALDPETVHKQATLATKVARAMLPKAASEDMIEDQALDLMPLTASALEGMLSRFASDEEDSEKEAKKASDEEEESKEEDSEKEAKKASDEEEDSKEEQQKAAGEMPPQFKENAEAKKEEAEAKKEEEESKEEDSEKEAKKASDEEEDSKEEDPEKEEQSKEASDKMVALNKKMADAIACGDMKAQQEAMQAMQQLMGQGQQQQVANDELMDQMLAEQEQQMVEGDIQMDTPQMDVGDVQLTDADAVLSQVFASSPDVQNAMKAAALQGLDVPSQAASAGMTRTASTRTVGTRPTEGVSTLGGAGSSNGAGSDTERLASLWTSAPDVSDAF